MASFSSDGKALFKLCMCVHIHKCVSSYTFLKRRWTFLTGKQYYMVKSTGSVSDSLYDLQHISEPMFQLPHWHHWNSRISCLGGVIPFPCRLSSLGCANGENDRTCLMVSIKACSNQWLHGGLWCWDYTRVVVVTKWDTASGYWVLYLVQRLPHGNHSRHSLA